MRATLIALTVALAWTVSVFAADQTQKIACDTTDGWAVLGDPPPATITATEGAIHIEYDRAELAPIGHHVTLTGLRELRLKIKSDVHAQVAIIVEDTDKAKFYYLMQLEAGKGTEVKIRPQDLLPDENSPVKKNLAEASKLGQGYALADAAPYFGGDGPNTLHIDEVTVIREVAP